MTAVLILTATLAVTHGMLIAWGSHDLKWTKLVRWYRWSTGVSTLILVLLVGLGIFVSFGGNWAKSLAEDLFHFSLRHAYLSGTVVIAFMVALVFTILDLVWMVPLQQRSSRPVVFWVLWFFVTFLGALLIPTASDQFIRENRAKLDEAEAAPTHQKAQADEVPPVASPNEPSPAAEPASQPAAAGVQSVSTYAAKTAAAAMGPPPPAWFTPTALLLLGGGYYFWTTSLLFRRITEVDRLVGNTARRLAFLPEIGAVFHPAQALVIGPIHSGKTELLRCMSGVQYPLTGPTLSTQRPGLARLRGGTHGKLFDVSIIDTGGEFMGDQLDVLHSVRTDCLVIVVCASHLVNKPELLSDPDRWDLYKVHELVDSRYQGGTSQAFFRALYYATNRAGHGLSDGRENNSNFDPVAAVYRVLVILKDRDGFQEGDKQYKAIDLIRLERLAQSIYRKLSRFDQIHHAEQNSAAIKLKLVMDEGVRDITDLRCSNALKVDGDRFAGWPYTLSGTWGEDEV